MSIGVRRLAKVTLFTLFFYLLVALTLYNCCLDRLVTAMYRGESLPFFNHLIHNTDNTPLSYYIGHARLLSSYLIFLGAATHLFLAAVLAHDYTRRVVLDFFSTPTSPRNLAIFRIVVFLGVVSQIHASETIWFGSVPHALQMAPLGVGWLLPHLPVSHASMISAVTFLYLVCATGLLGFFARTSALLALIGSFYVLGVPEFYGTVEHYHHLLWFLAILAVSPCGDALSIDALRNSAKRGTNAPESPQAESAAYSLPLRFACLLLGVIYFFPGFWKLRISGLDWAFTDNLRYTMYARWMDLDAFTPFFRLDLHPLLFRSIALGTLFFELSFFVLVFFPRLRLPLALFGLGFHFGSGLFMRIPFFDLWICYVALFDVSGALEHLRRGFSPAGNFDLPWFTGFAKTLQQGTGGNHPNVRAMLPRAGGRVPVVMVGIFLIAANSYWGALGIVRSWPFACYPRFAWNPGSQVESMEISALTPEGQVVFQGIPDFHRILPYHAFGGQLFSLLSMRTQDPGEFVSRVKALWALELQEDPHLARASTVRCYRIVLNTIPEERYLNPVQRDLILDLKM